MIPKKYFLVLFCRWRIWAKDLCIEFLLIGKDGFEEVVELDLSNKELEMFKNSIKAVKETNSSLIGLI